MRKIKDTLLNIMTTLASSVGLLVLSMILIFIFSNGLNRLSFKLIFTDYSQALYSLKLDNTSDYPLGNFENSESKEFFSSQWGIALEDTKNVEGEKVVSITYIAPNSPFKFLIDTSSEEAVSIQTGYEINKLVLSNQNNDYLLAMSKDGAKAMIEVLKDATIINDMVVTYGGGGIRGSLLTTLYLIILTLLIAMPIGVLAAIFLHEYAKQSKLIGLIRGMIDITSGIPSIIFGLVGAIIFIPFMNNVINSRGGSIASGALTLTIILLPTIIKTTEESLSIIPDSYRMASLALGASQTQTVFKVVLPNTISGVLTATLLATGRIIGESAALIYAVGTTISDSANINESSTSLAVHIWSLMSGENPNYETSCAIAIIIMLVVFILSVLVKILSKKVNKMEVN